MAAVGLELEDENDPTSSLEDQKGSTWLRVASCCSISSLWATARHLVVFMVLTFMHAFALLAFKLNVVDGEYPFSSASALVSTELLKLLMATQLHRVELKREGAPAGLAGLVASFRRTATPSLIASTTTITVMYTANNLLSYFCVAQMDPGTLSIAKALVPYLTAIVLQLFGRPVNALKWACIVLQCAGVATTQYHPKMAGDGGDSVTLYSWDMYLWLTLSVAITTTASVFNERIIKKVRAAQRDPRMPGSLRPERTRTRPAASAGSSRRRCSRST